MSMPGLLWVLVTVAAVMRAAEGFIPTVGGNAAALRSPPYPSSLFSPASRRLYSSPPDSIAPPNVVELSNIEELTGWIEDAQEPSVILVTASWCKACKKVTPAVLDIMGQNPEYRCGRVDMSDLGGNKEIKAHLGIRGVPMCIVYKGGKRVDHFTGSSEDSLKEFIMDNMT